MYSFTAKGSRPYSLESDFIPRHLDFAGLENIDTPKKPWELSEQAQTDSFRYS